MTAPVHFEDFFAGQTFAFGQYQVTAEEIAAFDREFGGVPPVAGETVASGAQVCAIAMRMCVDGLFNKTESRGGAGVETCRWIAPARAGDVLRMEIEILDVQPHPRRAVGFVKMRWDIFNRREQVASIVSTPLFAKKAAR